MPTDAVTIAGELQRWSTRSESQYRRLLSAATKAVHRWEWYDGEFYHPEPFWWERNLLVPVACNNKQGFMLVKRPVPKLLKSKPKRLNGVCGYGFDRGGRLRVELQYTQRDRRTHKMLARERIFHYEGEFVYDALFNDDPFKNAMVVGRQRLDDHGRVIAYEQLGEGFTIERYDYVGDALRRIDWELRSNNGKRRLTKARFVVGADGALVEIS